MQGDVSIDWTQGHRRGMPEPTARFYLAEVCLGLWFMHEQGIIYRYCAIMLLILLALIAPFPQ